MIVQECIEGTLLILYYNNGWKLSTRRCIDAYKSTWVKNISYGFLFNDIIKNKFNDINNFYSLLNINCCYHFIIVHHLNKNIVDYSKKYNENYKELYHILTTEIYTLNEIQFSFNEINNINDYHYDNLNDVLMDLNNINKNDVLHKYVSTEGFIIKIYQGEIYKSPFTLIKLQSDIYIYLSYIKPNKYNIYQCFLELFLKNKLIEYLAYFEQYNKNIIKHIHTSLQTMSNEILSLYFLTRNKNNPLIYNNLSASYKNILFKLHGIYIDMLKLNNNVKHNNKINKYIVYNTLIHLQPNVLLELYYDRYMFMKKKTNDSIFENKCINTINLLNLMFT